MSIQGQLLEVNVVGCRNLRDTEWISKQDPYVVLEYASSKFRTRTHTDGGRNPSFNEKISVPLIEGLRELVIQVWNSNTLAVDDHIGSGRVQLQNVLTSGYDDNSWPITSYHGKNAGEVRLIMHYNVAGKGQKMPGHVPGMPGYPTSGHAPPAGYPPAAGYPPSAPPSGYPPSASGYPPSVPPAGYAPSASGYPPTSYPPSGHGYAPSGAYPPGGKPGKVPGAAPYPGTAPYPGAAPYPAAAPYPGSAPYPAAAPYVVPPPAYGQPPAYGHGHQGYPGYADPYNMSHGGHGGYSKHDKHKHKHGKHKGKGKKWK